MIRFSIILTAIYLLGGFYGFQAFKILTKGTYLKFLYVIVFTAVALNLYIQFSKLDPAKGMTPKMGLAAGLFLSFAALGICSGIVMLLEDIIRLFGWIYNKFTFQGNTTTTFPARRKFISQLAMGIAAIPFLSLLYGMYKGKYDYRVLKYTLEYEDLPDAFDGYQITQISDIHSGSLDNAKKVAYVIDLINKQQSDVLFFTGDMVNNLASEMKPWIPFFSKLKAKDGLFSVLGNHDYGDYIKWKSKEAKTANLETLKTIQKKIGFDLLLNQHRFLQKNGQRIALIGVENWGAGRFKKAGDLNKATSNIDKNDFKILLSHDPSHWEKEVLNHPLHFHLTLSGHTHGMQFGVEIPGIIKWSPVKYRYKYWAGIYQQEKQLINVNRGLGVIGYPGRVGIWPEISVITLKKKEAKT